MAKTRFEIASPVIEAEMAKPYRLGTADCWFLAARVADAFDPKRRMAASLYRKYSNSFGAHRVLAQLGHATLASLVREFLVPCTPAECQFGDVVVVGLADGDHVGVCLGAKFVTKLPSGRSVHDLSAVKAAFRT